MQIPIIPFRGNQKPWSSIPRVNRLHPLARGLLFYHYDTGAGGYDLAGNRRWNLSSANPLSRASTRWGTGYQFASSVADGIRYTGDATLRILPPFSWACGFMRQTAATTEGDAGFFVRAANSIASQPFDNWGMEDFAGSVTNAVALAFNSGGTLTRSPTSVVLGLNQYHCVVASAPSTTTINWWANGIAQTDATGLTLQNVSTGDDIFLGTDLGGPTGFLGQIYWGAFWNRALKPAEALQLYLDPYSFLIYPEDEMFATLVGVAAVATSEDRFHQPWSSVGRRYAIIAAG